MELADFFTLLIWTLKGKLARISKPRRNQKLNPARIIEKGENETVQNRIPEQFLLAALNF
jgi:hypothetical protein